VMYVDNASRHARTNAGYSFFLKSFGNGKLSRSDLAPPVGGLISHSWWAGLPPPLELAVYLVGGGQDLTWSEISAQRFSGKAGHSCHICH
jgi:hypothetical protein